MAVTARKNKQGLFEVFKDNQRVATGSADILNQFNLTEDQVQPAPEREVPQQPTQQTRQRTEPLETPVPATDLTPTDSDVEASLPEREAPQAEQEFVTGLDQEVKSARAALESNLKRDQERVDRELESLRKREKEITDAQQELSEPFQAELEAKERERLHINENFEANQRLVGELESLVAEGNARLTGETNRFASRSSIQSGFSRTLQDITARAGLIEATISARDGQIAQAHTMINRSVAAITADRQDQLAYWDTLLDLNNQKQLSLDSESKKVAEEQRNLLKGDLDRAEKTADSVRQAMLDPDLARAYAEAGVTLLDTPEDINEKLSDYAYSKEVRDTSNQMAFDGFTALAPGQSAPAGTEVVTITDSKGVERRYSKPEERLSVSEAKALGVPFGTTRSQAFGITPSDDSGTSIADLLTDGGKTETGQIDLQDLSNVPRDRLETVAATIARELPDATARNSALGGLATFRNAQDILDLLDEGAVTGPISGRIQSGLGIPLPFTDASIPLVPGARTLGTSSEKQNELSAATTAFTANFIKSISGAQVSDREREFLMQALPSENNQEGVNRSNLKMLSQFIKNDLENRLGIDLDPLLPETARGEEEVDVGDEAESYLDSLNF